jgi:MFS family permease
VVSLQVPLTRALSRFALTTQMALGGFIYAAGYAVVGFCAGFHSFILAVVMVTFAEIAMSPAALALTSRLAPEGRIGRYMGVFGFFVAAGWSFGPLYGGTILDRFAGQHVTAWAMIASMALLPAIGYLFVAARVSAALNRADRTSKPD